MPHPVGDGRGDLEAARPCADHGDTLLGEVDRVVPTGRVECRPGEGLLTRDLRDVRTVQLADSGNDGSGDQRRFGPVLRPHPHRPGAAEVVPFGAQHFVLQRTCDSMPCFRITDSKYDWSSGCWAKNSVHAWLGSKL